MRLADAARWRAPDQQSVAQAFAARSRAAAIAPDGAAARQLCVGRVTAGDPGELGIAKQTYRLGFQLHALSDHGVLSHGILLVEPQGGERWRSAARRPRAVAVCAAVGRDFESRRRAVTGTPALW